MQEKVSELEARVSKLEARVSELEATSYDGRLLWKVSDVRRLQQLPQEAIGGRAPFLQSPFFYTAPNGHKMCVRIYLNGEGDDIGTQLSLFFVVYRSNYDA